MPDAFIHPATGGFSGGKELIKTFNLVDLKSTWQTSGNQLTANIVEKYSSLILEWSALTFKNLANVGNYCNYFVCIGNAIDSQNRIIEFSVATSTPVGTIRNAPEGVIMAIPNKRYASNEYTYAFMTGSLFGHINIGVDVNIIKFWSEQSFGNAELTGTFKLYGIK